MRMIVMNLLSFLHLSDLFHLTSCSFTASVPRQSQEVHEELKAGSGIITDKTLFEHVVKQPYMLPTSGFFQCFAWRSTKMYVLAREMTRLTLESSIQ